MFNSPLEWCSLCRDWVALDQSFEEHVRECGRGCKREACPLVTLSGRPFRPRSAPDNVVQTPPLITRPATERSRER